MESFSSIKVCYVQDLHIQLKYLNRNSAKNILISSKKKKKKQKKKINFYVKLTKAKSSFDSNQIFSKLWLYMGSSYTWCNSK